MRQVWIDPMGQKFKNMFFIMIFYKKNVINILLLEKIFSYENDQYPYFKKLTEILWVMTKIDYV